MSPIYFHKNENRQRAQYDRANSQVQNTIFQHSHHHQLRILTSNEQEPVCCTLNICTGGGWPTHRNTIQQWRKIFSYFFLSFYNLTEGFYNRTKSRYEERKKKNSSKISPLASPLYELFNHRELPQNWIKSEGVDLTSFYNCILLLCSTELFLAGHLQHIYPLHAAKGP